MLVLSLFVLVLGLLLVARFADTAGPVAFPDQTPASSTASPSSDAPGTSEPGAGSPADDEDATIVRDTLAAQAPELAPEIPAPPGEAATAAAGQAPEGAAEPDILTRLGFDPGPLREILAQQLGREAPGIDEALAALGEWASDLYLNRYTPLAQELRQTAAQQQQYYAWLQQFVGSEPYQLAAWLQANPAALEQVRTILAGGGPTRAAPAAATSGDGAELDPEALDPETRRLYEYVGALEQRLADLHGRFGQMGQWHQQQAAAQAEWQRGQDRAALGHLLGELCEQASARLGLDVRAFPQHLERAARHVETHLLAVLRRVEEARQAGQDAGRLLPPAEQMQNLFAQWFDEGLRLAGYEQLAEQRRSAARKTPRLPGGRAAGGAGSGSYDEQVVHEALAQAGMG